MLFCFKSVLSISRPPRFKDFCLCVPRLFRLFPFQGSSCSYMLFRFKCFSFRFKCSLPFQRLIGLSFRFEALPFQIISARFESLPFQMRLFPIPFSSVSMTSLSVSSFLFGFKSSLPNSNLFLFENSFLRFKSSLPFHKLLFPIRRSSVASLLFPFQGSSVQIISSGSNLFRFKNSSLRFKSFLPFQGLLFPIRGSSVSSLFGFKISRSVPRLLCLK